MKPRIAIVSDPLVQRGGAERLVEALAEAFPEAPIFALLYSAQTGPAKLQPRVRASWLNSVPTAKSNHRMFLPLYRSAIESLDVSAFDIVISSHHTVGKAVLTRADQLHICYCHTPMRAMWERPIEELATLKQPARAIASRILSHLRVWDVVTANRPQKYIANSGTTKRRIADYYRRESDIVFPPIDTELFTLGSGSAPADDYYLIASRPVPYKRIDIAIAATGLLGRKVKIVGGKHAIPNPPPHVELLGHVSDTELRDLMRGARALLLPQLEDFGMAPLEANACGRPVVAYGAGGALDTVIDGVTGVFSDRQEVDSFAAAIRRLESTQFNPSALRFHAMRFSKERFIANMQTVVANAWKAHAESRKPHHAAALSLVEIAGA